MNKAVTASMLGAYLVLSHSDAIACHRFALWRYPWPQRCSNATHEPQRSSNAAPTPPIRLADASKPLPGAIVPRTGDATVMSICQDGTNGQVLTVDGVPIRVCATDEQLRDAAIEELKPLLNDLLIKEQAKALKGGD